MPTILTLDGHHYLVPDSVNLNVLTKTLRDLQKLRWDYERPPGLKEFYVREPGGPSIKIEITEKSSIREPKKPKQLTAKAGPDANGDMGVS